MPNVHVLDDAVTGVHLAQLRDTTTPPSRFQHHARQLGLLLALAALRELPSTTGQVVTPLAPAPTTGPAVPVVAVPVLRAGLGLLAGLQDVVPSLIVGMIGLARDPHTLEASEYFHKMPDVDGGWVLILEPMLATGGSAAWAVERALQAGAADVSVLSVVATDVAVERIGKVAPDARIVTAAVDPELDDNGYIVPGLGDFGDRLYGTHH